MVSKVIASLAYDSMDRLAMRTDPLGREEFYQYDLNGNLIQFTDRKGQVSTFVYDPLDRRTRSDFADGTFTQFTFDAAGRLIRASDSQTGTIIEEYDLLDRLIRETTPQGTISYAYDPLGRRTTMTVDGQSPVTYIYDTASRLRTITQASVLSPVTIDYDALGRRTLLTLPNAVSTEYQYDPASRLTALIYRNAFGLLGDLTYEYDPAGNRTAVGGSFARTLLPDPVLTSSYDAANQQLTFGDKTMTFDANGNLEMITDPTGTTTFTWDARTQLAALGSPTVTASFQYDALGRRIIKLVNQRNFTYQYDDIDIVREILDGSEISYLRGLNIDEPLTRTDGATSRTILADALGTTLALVDPSGLILDGTYTYESFGRGIYSGTPNDNSFQYTGRENDGTGLYYYRARYYMPIVGRFISEDPAGFIAGPNFYSYVLNAPINLHDPFGLVPKCPDCPGGVWATASAYTTSAFLVFGGSYSLVSFTCISNGLFCLGQVTCRGVGPNVSFTPGLSGITGGRVVGASQINQLKGENFGYQATALLFGGSLNFTVTSDRIFGQPVSGDAGIANSYGLGIALVRCKTTIEGCLR